MNKLTSIFLGLSLLVSYGLSCFILESHQTMPAMILLALATYECNDLGLFKYFDKNKDKH